MSKKTPRGAEVENLASESQAAAVEEAGPLDADAGITGAVAEAAKKLGTTPTQLRLWAERRAEELYVEHLSLCGEVLLQVAYELLVVGKPAVEMNHGNDDDDPASH